ncbi:MAG TPA: tetratricopeptide repeat protein [Chthoniobacteraceae bacterium]|nr:tetratricopeptide repeat protein [Chthoniobacteraceae bacterium]
MPTTYNGVGTRYYGERNITTHSGVCKSCNRQVNLRSYETRLWFVVLFIPVIPLGRKRILDDCPVCRRHYVMPLEKWETARQLNVSGALQEFHQDPTPDNAIRVHQQLIGFRQFNEAAEFRGIIDSQFKDNARVQAYLGEELSGLGKPLEAARYYQRALELRPDMPEARAGVALEKIRIGQLDEARQLLSHLEQPGAEKIYPLGPLETLGNAYQKAGRHADAMAIYTLLLRAIPSAAQHEGFRKRVKASETALKSKTSILPRKKFSLRGGGGASNKRAYITVAAIVFLIALIAAGVNEYTRRHRTLYIVNGFDKPATVSIDGRGSVTAPPGVQTSIQIPEGKWRAHITGPVTQDVDFEVNSGYFDRWGGNPAWLLNVGGSALLVQEHARYSAVNSNDPGSYDFIYEKPFITFPQMDYPFQELPKSITVDSHETSDKFLTNIRFFRGQPINAVNALYNEKRLPDAIHLVRWALNLHPDDTELLEAYSGLAESGQAHADFLKFLRDGLSRRPVAIEWHRAYQESVRGTAEGGDTLRASYDAMLQKDPGNSALLYLCGRIATSSQAGADYFNRALKADPKNGYAYYALGYNAMSLGQWQEALPLLTHAVEFNKDGASFWSNLQDDRFGLRDYASIEGDARAKLKQNPLDWEAVCYLTLALVADSHPDDAYQVVSNYETRMLKANGTNEPVDPSLRMLFLYASNKPDAIEKTPFQDSEGGEAIHDFVLMEEGRPADVEKTLTTNNGLTYIVAMATAYLLKGDTAHAAPWIDKASQELEKSGDADFVQAGKFLAGSTAPSADDYQKLIITPGTKALIAACLAVKFPDHASDFGAIAARYNILLNPPHNLIAQVVAKTHPAP